MPKTTRVTVDLGDVEPIRSAIAIVRQLADGPPPVNAVGFTCAFCRAHVLGQDGETVAARHLHAPECLWRQARDWLSDHVPSR